MRYVAAYLLAVLGKNDSPSANDLKSIIESVGVGFDKERAEMVVKKLAGKSIPELIAEGQTKMASMPSGGAAAAPAAAAGGDAPAEKKAEEKKKESASESEDDDMGFGLFD